MKTLGAALGCLTLSLLTPVVVAIAPTALAAVPAATCAGLPATIVGTPGDDRIVGTPGPDVIAALGGNDRVRGRAGHDVVCGGDGFDVLDGGHGADRLHGGLDGLEFQPDADFRTRVGDVVVGGPGDDVLDPGRDRRASIRGVRGGYETLDVLSFAGSSRGVQVDLARGTARGQGRDRLVVAGPVQVVTTRHDDVVRAAGASVGIVAGPGDDLLVGSPHDDRLEPDGRRTSVQDLRGGPVIPRDPAGDDVVRARGGDDELSTTGGRDVLDAGAGDDSLSSYGRPTGSRFIAGAGSDDVFVDGLRDGLRVDLRRGGRDHVHLTIARPGGASSTWDLGSGLLTLPDGTRAVVDRAPRTTLVLGRGGVATVTGSSLSERLQVEGGTTRFAGLGGDDVFEGYLGRDTFDGGDGTDTYAYDPGGRASNTCASVERDPSRVCAPA